MEELNVLERELTPEEMLCAELAAIRQSRRAEPSAVYQALYESNLTALCLSGGGIRSATFALGVIQALAQRLKDGSSFKKDQFSRSSLLSGFDYLSTVSGGGYIGSCLSAWIERRSYAEVRSALTSADAPGEHPDDSRPTRNDLDVLSWLRRYTNYLTPKLGLASGDTWAAVAIALRNIVLNWLVLMPLFIALVLVVDLLSFGAVRIGQVSPYFDFDGWGMALPLGAMLLFGFALFCVGRFRPSRETSRAKPGTVLACVVAPLVLGSILLSSIVAFPSMVRFVNQTPSCVENQVGTCVRELSFWSALAGALLCTLARFFAFPRTSSGKDVIACAISGVAFGALLGVGIYFQTMTTASDIALVILGVPWCLASYLVSDMLFTGVSSYIAKSDADREWLARVAGVLMAIMLVWLIITGLVLLGGRVALGIVLSAKKFLAALGLTGVITAGLSASKSTPAKGPAKGGIAISANLLLGVVAPIFAASLIVILAVIADHLLFDASLGDGNFWSTEFSFTNEVPTTHDIYVSLWALLATLVVGAIASRFININRFSLHALYRNRIIRAFLGGSHIDRETTVDLFSGFDIEDNLPMHQLWEERTGQNSVAMWQNGDSESWRPFYVVNMALNLVGGKNLAWQERKAESFTASPLHTGSAKLGYRNSSVYGDPNGISVGTAVAISGAAASSNMGYHSSPALSFLLTLFNVRLGWWLGNPGASGKNTFKREGPRFAAVPLVAEMLGMTDDSHPYVYLSDGGHFENLGLYEMVRRRCHLIVVSDAGCDADFAFEDLGNAVRKISIDLGITIEFTDLEQLRCRKDCERRDDTELASVATGTIYYSRHDAGAPDGKIIYIKPTFYTGAIKNVGVRNYGVSHPEFPHESTSDQWFSESQFESYRALGFEIMDSFLQKCGSVPGTPADMIDFFTQPAKAS